MRCTRLSSKTNLLQATRVTPACQACRPSLTGHLVVGQQLDLLAGVATAVLGNPAVLTAMAVPAGLFFGTVFYVSLYATFSDCFVDGGAVVDAARTDAT
jgi:hypothetical protein